MAEMLSQNYFRGNLVHILHVHNKQSRPPPIQRNQRSNGAKQEEKVQVIFAFSKVKLTVHSDLRNDYSSAITKLDELVTFVFMYLRSTELLDWIRSSFPTQSSSMQRSPAPLSTSVNKVDKEVQTLLPSIW